MNVGIDIDGVITNLDFIKQGKRKDRHTVLDTNPALTYQNNKLINYLLYRGICLYSKHAVVRDNASKVINNLKNEQCKIYIITKRQFASENNLKGEKVRKLVELHLLEHEIPYDSITYTDGNKLKECLELGIDILIEDNPYIAQVVSKYIPVILLETPYNKDTNEDNILHATSWVDINILIKNRIHKVYRKEILK